VIQGIFKQIEERMNNPDYNEAQKKPTIGAKKFQQGNFVKKADSVNHTLKTPLESSKNIYLKKRRSTIFSKYSEMTKFSHNITTSANEVHKLKNSNLSNTALALKEKFAEHLEDTLDAACVFFEKQLKKEGQGFQSSGGTQIYYCIKILDTKNLKMQLMEITETEVGECFKLKALHSFQSYSMSVEKKRIFSSGEIYPTRKDVFDVFGIDYGKMSFSEKKLVWFSYMLRAKLPYLDKSKPRRIWI
jgi:hypothetical protein